MINERSVYQDHIVVDPEIMAGKPIVKGTRIPVELVLKRLAQDLDISKLFEAYPRLTALDVKACLAYATEVIAGEEAFPLQPDNTHQQPV